jgi:hypothetical protein
MNAFNHDHDQHDHEHDNANREDHADDNGVGAVAPSSKGTALASASLAALTATLRNVNTAAVSGRPGLPMLLFKSRANNGTWTIGQKQMVPESGSLWAVNPMSFEWGFISFSGAKKVLGEEMVPVNKPKPDITKLPDTGFKWQEQWSVQVRCLTGIDRGVQAVFKATTDGAIKAVAGLIDAVRDRLEEGQHDGKIVPIVRLEKDSYQHREHGQTWFPVLPIDGWEPFDGPAPAPKPASPPPAEQPRRRRVA